MMSQTWHRLADVCQVNPKFVATGELNADSPVSFVPMAAVDETFGEIASREARSIGEVRRGYTPFRDDDVLFAKITPCMQNGKAALARGLVNGIGFGSTEFHVLRAGPLVLPEWVFRFVRRPAFRSDAARNFTGTAGQQRVPTSFIEAAQIPVPPLETQRSLCERLDRAEGILRLRLEAQRKAAELIPALFLERFGDPSSNPKGWSVEDLSELLSAPIRNGVSPSKSGTTPGRVLTLSAITRGAFDAAMVKECKFANAVAESDEVSVEDFLVCRGNGNADLVGVGCYPQANMPGVAFPDTMMAVRVRRDRVNPDYLAAHWATHFMRQQIKAIAKTTNGTLKINQRGVGALRIQVPPFHLQTRFSEHVQSIRALLVQSETALKTAQATFDALLHQAFPAT